MPGSKLFALLVHLLAVTYSIVYATIAHYVTSRRKLVSKVVELWVGNKYTLPYSVPQDQTEAESSDQLDVSKTTELSVSYSTDCPAYQKKYSRAQSKLVASADQHVQNASAANSADNHANCSKFEDSDAITPLNLESSNSNKAQKRRLLNASVKIEEYNAINMHYILRKHIERQNRNDFEPAQLHQLLTSTELDYSTICRFMFPTTNPLIISKISNLPKSRPTKHRRQTSFQPTKLSTIFENLAY